MMKRILAILLALAMLLSVSAVFAEAEETAAETAAEEPAAVPDTLLVTVLGQEIRENNEKLQFYLSDILSDNDNTNEETLHIAKMFSMQYVLETYMFDEKLNSFDPTEVEAAKQNAKEDWENVVNQFMTQLFGITEESSEEDKTAARADALNYIETNYGYTESLFMENQLYSLAYDSIVKEMKASRTDLAATDEEIQAMYDDIVKEEMEALGNDAIMYEMYQNYYGYAFHFIPEGYRGITHILLKADKELLDNWIDLSARLEESKESAEATDEADGTEQVEEPSETEEPVTEEMVEAARQAILDSQKDKIDEIKAKLESGISFEDLITEYGEDDGMKNETYLKNGYSLHPDAVGYDRYDTNFAKAAAALEKVGDISDPVVSQFGIHILYYLRDIPAGPLDISDDEKEELRTQIESENISNAFEEYYTNWLNNSDIIWTTEGEAWKFDQEAYSAYMNPEDEDAEEDEAEEEAEAEVPAEPAAEEETAAEPEETPAP